MPKVNPDTGEMMDDNPDTTPDDQRGARQGSDLHDGANPTGSGGPTQQGLTEREDRGPTQGQ